jgi:hypothetical protein
MKMEKGNGPKGIRTPVTDVRGQCPRPLDDGTTLLIQFQMSNDKFQIPAYRKSAFKYLVQINAQLVKNQAIFH